MSITTQKKKKKKTDRKREIKRMLINKFKIKKRQKLIATYSYTKYWDIYEGKIPNCGI